MRNILMVILITISLTVFAQNSNGKMNDAGRITLASYIPAQVDNLPIAARNMLANKLSQIVTQNGMSGSSYNERFIITANIVTLTKDVTPTAPPMQSYTIDLTLYIGDGIEGTKFSSYSTTLLGVGENETKAYISALKNFKTNNPNYQEFIDKGKRKIIEYYNSKCDFIIKEAQVSASQNQFEEAIYKLMLVPDVCKECFDKCMDAVAPIYKKKIDRDCKKLLSEANNIWATNQTVEVANQAAELLSQIEPSAACYNEVKPLLAKISARVKEIDKRDWQYVLKEQSQISERINAYREIGVAYGNGQPKSITYNVKGWW